MTGRIAKSSVLPIQHSFHQESALTFSIAQENQKCQKNFVLSRKNEYEDKIVKQIRQILRAAPVLALTLSAIFFVLLGILNPYGIYAPIAGKAVLIREAPDPAFTEGMRKRHRHQTCRVKFSVLPRSTRLLTTFSSQILININRQNAIIYV